MLVILFLLEGKKHSYYTEGSIIVYTIFTLSLIGSLVILDFF